jgi:hypothetical protein
MNASIEGTLTAHPITIVGPEPMVIDPASAKRRPILNAEEARLLTAEIQRTSVRLWVLVVEAHDRSAHFALGYDSWEDYVRAELKMSPSRSYQILDLGHIMRELAVAGYDVESLTPPPARVVARIKDRLPEVRKVVKAAIKQGAQPDEALRELARQPRRGEVEQPASEQTVKPDGSPADGEKVDRRRTALLTCPACAGEGKVSRSLAGRLRAFLKAQAAESPPTS